MTATYQRVLIYTGGNVDDSMIDYITEEDFIIGADHGALFLVDHNIVPHISAGDFDSVSPEELDRIRKHSHKVITCDAIDKDLTDTELALNLALEQRPQEIVMMGCLGTRLDHSLVNIQLLMIGIENNVKISIVDQHNYITLTDSNCKITNLGFTYVSLLPLTAEVTGIDLEGFMYPLHNATLKIGQSLGVSNRLVGHEGRVTIRSGLLLIIQSKD